MKGGDSNLWVKYTNYALKLNLKGLTEPNLNFAKYNEEFHLLPSRRRRANALVSKGGSGPLRVVKVRNSVDNLVQLT